jgi:hypothetical protein
MVFSITVLVQPSASYECPTVDGGPSQAPTARQSSTWSTSPNSARARAQQVPADFEASVRHYINGLPALSPVLR